MANKSLLIPASHDNIESVRWNEAKRINSNVIPLTVADMDFKAPQEITDAIQKIANTGNFSYVEWSQEYFKAVQYWFSHRHHWEIPTNWIVPIGRMCEVTAEILRSVVGENSNVILPYPSYSPTAAAIRAANCHIIPWPLSYNNGYYQYDFDSLPFLMNDANAIILTNPHNPTGRVWTKEEQERIAKIAAEKNIFVISDEFHADLTFDDHPYVPFLSTCEEARENGIALVSPGKTFNIAALETANIIVASPKIREIVKIAVDNSGCHNPRFFADIATTTAYTKCESWLDEILELVQKHRELLISTINEIPNVKMTQSQGTYLMWIDCRNLKLTSKQLKQRLIDNNLLLDTGDGFGSGGTGFLRMNVAVPDEEFMVCLKRFKRALSI